MSDSADLRFERHLSCFLSTPEGALDRTRAANAMLRMVVNDYKPPEHLEIPHSLSEQFNRIITGSASPTHALEALVGGEAIGALNRAEGRAR